MHNTHSHNIFYFKNSISIGNNEGSNMRSDPMINSAFSSRWSLKSTSWVYRFFNPYLPQFSFKSSITLPCSVAITLISGRFLATNMLVKPHPEPSSNTYAGKGSVSCLFTKYSARTTAQSYTHYGGSTSRD